MAMFRLSQRYGGLQFFSPGAVQTDITVNGTTSTIYSDYGAPFWSDATGDFTISNNLVVWNDGKILQYNGVDVVPTDTVIGDGAYTTRAATPAISFTHRYQNSTLIGTGTYKFRRYSVEEPVVTPSGETWVLNDEPEFVHLIVDINFVSNNISYSRITISNAGKFEKRIFYDDTMVAQYTTDGFVSWNGGAYRTITFSTAPTGDLLTWLQANGTKQGTATLISFTISGTSYQAESGMTWGQWVASSYNTGGYYVNSLGNIAVGAGGGGGAMVTTDSAYNNAVTSADVITATTYYYGMPN